MIKSQLLRGKKNAGIKKIFQIIFLVITLATSFQLHAQQVINLYPGIAPGSENWNWEEKEFFVKEPMNAKVVYNVSKPTLTVYSPGNSANGSAVLLIPGGGFRIVNIENEGTRLAKELNAKGYTVFVLKYRVAQSLSDDPFKELMQAMADSAWKNKIRTITELALNDAKMSLKHIKENAAKYSIQPGKIGIAGFSAGGTLSIQLALNEDADQRPDFVALIYSVFRPENFSIPSNIPPAFIACASDDVLAPSVNSVNLYNSWMKAAQNAELHIYATGGHGLRSGNAVSWINRFIEWMQLKGF